MLRFIHAADFHLDSAFAALTPRQAAARRRESRELLGALEVSTPDADIDALVNSFGYSAL